MSKMKGNLLAKRTLRRGGVHRNAIAYATGTRFSGGMAFVAHDDSQSTPSMFVQCPYCGDVVSMTNAAAKTRQSCGCHTTKFGKKTIQFAKGWIYDSDAGTDKNNHPLVNVHSKWNPMDTAVMRLGNLKSGKVRWASSSINTGVDESYRVLFEEQWAEATMYNKRKAINELLAISQEENKLYSPDEAFTFECLTKKMLSCACDNTVYLNDKGEIAHGGNRFVNNEPYRADFQFKMDGFRIYLENDGIGHEQPVHGEEALRERQERDRTVEKFCADNNIGLIRVSYRMIEDRDDVAYKAFLKKAFRNTLKQLKANAKAAKIKA
jgi:hypothetical protein